MLLSTSLFWAELFFEDAFFENAVSGNALGDLVLVLAAFSGAVLTDLAPADLFI